MCVVHYSNQCALKGIMSQSLRSLAVNTGCSVYVIWQVDCCHVATFVFAMLALHKPHTF